MEEKTADELRKERNDARMLLAMITDAIREPNVGEPRSSLKTRVALVEAMLKEHHERTGLQMHGMVDAGSRD